MNLRIRRVGKLERHHGVGNLRDQFLGAGGGALHAVRGRSENGFGSQQSQNIPSFRRHRIGHGENATVAASGRHHS